MAEKCLNYTAQDIDGYSIFNYLGKEFISALALNEKTKVVMGKARNFAEQEFDKYRSLKNSKLALRHSLLLNYFEAHRNNWE